MIRRTLRWLTGLGLCLAINTTLLAGSSGYRNGPLYVLTTVVAAQDSVPPANSAPRKTVAPPERRPTSAPPTATAAQQARAAVLIEHTRLGIVPPDPDELARRDQDRQQAAKDRKEEQLAILADRLERRRQRLEELKAEGVGSSRKERRRIARMAKAAAKREAARKKKERERAEVLAKQEAERKEREALKAKRFAAGQAERERKRAMQEARDRERAERLAAQRAEQEKMRAGERAAAEARAARLAKAAADRAKARPTPKPAPPPAPKLTKEERAQLARDQRALAKRLARESKAARRQARIDFRNGRADRKAARMTARREAARARRQEVAQRKAERNELRLARLAQKQVRKNAALAARAARNAARKERRDARLAAKEAQRADRLARRAARRAATLAARAARNAERLARRNARLAAREARRAARLARREARRAARLARREARRLRRQQNPPYWTAEPSIAIGLPLRSGGASDEKSLEAISVQALAGYHRAKGLSIRGGVAVSLMASKMQTETTRTETVTQTGVVRIVQHPDGSRTEETGPIQVRQTVTTKARYFNRLSSIDVPLLIGYRVPGNKFALLVEAGPCFNLSSGGEAHTRTEDRFVRVGSGHFISRRAGFGVLLQGSGEYRLTDKTALTGAVRLQTFGKAFERENAGLPSTRVATISLQVGYRVRF